MTPVDRIKYRGFYINIYSDDDPQDPIKDWDCAGTMICFHSRYDLGHAHNYDPETVMQELAAEVCPGIDKLIDYWENGAGWEKFRSEEKTEGMIEKAVNAVIKKYYLMLDLHLYDHGGITIHTAPFSCPWDSSNVGFIYITKEKAKKEWPGPDYEKRALAYLENEVKTYDMFLTGEVYGYVVEPTEANKSITCDDACWGFFGAESIENDIIPEAKSAIDYAISDYLKQIKKDKAIREQTKKFFKTCWAD